MTQAAVLAALHQLTEEFGLIAPVQNRARDTRPMCQFGAAIMHSCSYARHLLSTVTVKFTDLQPEAGMYHKQQA